MTELGTQYLAGSLGGKFPPAALSFRVQFERLLDKHNVQNDPGGSAAFYMFLGFVLTLPISDRFDEFNIKNIYLSEKAKNLKMVITSTPEGRTTPLVKAFIFNGQVNGLTDIFLDNRIALLYQRLTDDLPSVGIRDFKSCFENIETLSLLKPAQGSYGVHTDDGYITVPSDQQSPYIAEIDRAYLDIHEKVKAEPKTREHDETEFVVLQKSQSYLDRHLEALNSKEARDVARNGQTIINILAGIFKQHQLSLNLDLQPANFLAFAFGALHFNFKQKFSLVLEPKFNFESKDFQSMLIHMNKNDDKWFVHQIPIEYRIFGENDRKELNLEQEAYLPSNSNVKTEECVIIETGISIKATSKGNRPKFSYFTSSSRVAKLERRKTFLTRLLDLRKVYFTPESTSTEFIAIEIKALLSSIVEAGKSLNMNFVEPYFSYYLLGQLMAYEAHDGKTIDKFIFKYENMEYNDYITSILLKTENDESGILIHIIEPKEHPLHFILENPPVPVTEVEKLFILTLDFGTIFGERLSNSEPILFHTGIVLHHLLDASKIMSPEEGLFVSLSASQKIRQDFFFLQKSPSLYAKQLLKVVSKINKKVETHVQFEALIKGYLTTKFKSMTPFSGQKSVVLVTNEKSNDVILMKVQYGDSSDFVLKAGLSILRARYMPEYVSSVHRREATLVLLACTYKGNDQYEFSTLIESTTGKNREAYESCLEPFRKRRKRGSSFCDMETDNTEEKENSLIMRNQRQGRTMTENADLHAVVLHHLETVNTFASALMNLAIAKNVIGALISGDYKSVAINLAFVSGSIAFGQLSRAAAEKGLEMAQSNKILAGTMLRSAAPFLARVSSGFIIFDLYQQIQSLNAGNGDAAVAVAGDSAIILLDAAQLGLELAETFNIIEGIAAFTGPIAGLAGALTFIGLDVYYAVKRVEEIKRYIHLSAWETFAEGFLAFLHANPPEYIQHLIEGKKLEDLSERRAMQLMGHLNVYYFLSPELQKDRDTVSEVLNNTVDLTIRRNISRKEWPTEVQGYRQICSSDQGFGDTTKYIFLCSGMIGLRSLNTTRSRKALIHLNSGNDTAKGFRTRPNIFVIGSGMKEVSGGLKGDVFILYGNESILGNLNGKEGNNMLMMKNYMLNNNLVISCDQSVMSISVQNSSIAEIIGTNMSHLILRNNLGETVQCSCEINFLNSGGGDKVQLDYLTIPDLDCIYNMDLIVNSFTRISNHQLNESKFIYRLVSNPHDIEIILENKNSSAEHLIILNNSLSDIHKLNYMQNTLVIEFFDNHTRSISIKNMNNRSIVVTNDQFQIHKQDESIIVNKEISDEDFEPDVSLYMNYTRFLDAHMILYNIIRKQRVIIGQEVPHNMSHLVLQNDAQFETFVVGSSQVENIFRITDKHGDCSKTLPPTVIYSKRLNDMIDLNHLYYSCQNQGHRLHVQPKIKNDDLMLKIFKSEKRREIVTSIAIKYSNNFTDLAIKLKIPMKITKLDSQLTMEPIPLNFKDVSLIMLSDSDLDTHLTIRILDKKLGDPYDHFYRLANHLIVTNVFHDSIDKSDIFTMFFVDFYSKNFDATLKITFADDKVIFLPDVTALTENFHEKAAIMLGLIEKKDQ